MDRALRHYRIMARVTGVTLIALCLILLVKAFGSSALWENIKVLRIIVGMGHGVLLYPIYLVTCFQLVLKARIKLVYFVLLLLAGFVPGLAFVMESYTEKNLVPRKN